MWKHFRPDKLFLVVLPVWWMWDSSAHAMIQELELDEVMRYRSIAEVVKSGVRSIDKSPRGRAASLVSSVVRRPASVTRSAAFSRKLPPAKASASFAVLPIARRQKMSVVPDIELKITQQMPLGRAAPELEFQGTYGEREDVSAWVRLKFDF